MAEFLLGVMLFSSVTLQFHFQLTSIVQLSHVHRLPIVRSSAKMDGCLHAAAVLRQGVTGTREKTPRQRLKGCGSRS